MNLVETAICITSRFRLLLICFTAMFLISSCEAPESQKTKVTTKDTSTETVRSTLPTISYKGMYFVDGTNKLQECSSGRSYLISEASELRQLNETIQAAGSLVRNKRVYIEGDGFVSSRDNPKTKGTDTVLILTGVSRIDMQFDCISN